MSETPLRYLGYCRQSITRGDADDSLSLIGQERAIRQMIAASGGVLLEPMIIDADERGNDPHRPGLKLLIERAETERPDAIAVYAVSRFARDNWLAESVWRRLLQTNKGLIFRSVTEPQAQDDLVRGILGVISQAERKRMGAFLASAFAERARQGKPHGKAPYGYTKDADGRLIVDEDAAPVVRAIFDRYDDGWSLRRIARWLTEDQHQTDRRWKPMILQYVLRSPAMIGTIKTGGIETPDAHEPIIDRAQWDRVQTRLDERRYHRTKQASSWLEGLMVCGCGATMRLVANVKPTGVKPQFRCAASPWLDAATRSPGVPLCTWSPRSITSVKAERLTGDALTRDLAAMLDWSEVVARLDAEYRAGQKGRLKERSALERQIARLADQRDRLLTLYTRGSLDVPRWEAEDAALDAQISAARAALDALPEPPDATHLRAVAETLGGFRAALPAMLDADPMGARRLLQAVGATVQLAPGGLVIRWPEPYRAFLGALV